MLIRGKMVRCEKDGKIYTGKISSQAIPVVSYSTTNDIVPQNPTDEYWVDIETQDGKHVSKQKMKFHLSCLKEIDR